MRVLCVSTISLVMLFLATPVQAGGVPAVVGLEDLSARIGAENIPTGLNVIVGQVEVDSGGYGPDQNHAAFDGKTFFPMSGAPGSSGHATTVGANFYGNSSIAPGITDVYLWEANHWLQFGFLRVGAGATIPPWAPPAEIKVFNHSWVGSYGSSANDNDVLRRADFVMERDDLLMVVGVNNGGTNFTLMSHQYNGLSVGLMGGGHTSGATGAGADGPGRMKPEIVAPNSLTSFSTPVVGAAVALLNEVAVSDPAVSGNPNAQRSDVIKAILLGGANHRMGWTNNPETTGPDRGFTDQPMDQVYGVDLVNVDTSHWIMTGGEQDGADMPPESANISEAGWDLATLPLDGSVYWRFGITQLADEVSILASWRREVSQFFNAFWLADFDLTLWGVGDGGELVSLLGDPGIDYFADGNVVSDSAVDNIEHLYIRDLEPGDYVLELRRLDAWANFPNWDVAVTWVMPSQGSPADLNGDGVVDAIDLADLLGAWGPCEGCPADLNGDGVVEAADLAELLGAWS